MTPNIMYGIIIYILAIIISLIFFGLIDFEIHEDLRKWYAEKHGIPTEPRKPEEFYDRYGSN